MIVNSTVESKIGSMKSRLGSLLLALTAAWVRAADPFLPPKIPLPSFPARTINVKGFGALAN
jgi:hypothetical protein